MLDLSVGEPKLWEEFYNLPLASLQEPSVRYPVPLKELKEQIYKLHEWAGNVRRPRDYEVVIGNGASQVMQAAIASYESRQFSYVYAKSPYFQRFPAFVKYSGRPFKFTDDEGMIGQAQTLEIVTLPNNPDNTVRPYTNGTISRVYDCSYMWPQYGPYSDNQIKEDPEVMVFSAAKAVGLAGYRVGWALVRKRDRAERMDLHIEMQTGGVSDIAQDLMIDLLHRKGTDAITYGADLLLKRWACVRAVMMHKTSVKLLNTSGMFMWVQAPQGADWLDATMGIKSAHGEGFGSDIYHARINVACSMEEFAFLFDKLSALE